MDTPCPLCGSTATREWKGPAAQRTFLRCLLCELVFVPQRFHLSAQEARALYEQHQNDADDPRYRAFLSRLFTPLRALLDSGAQGLDFGCGPGPTLSVMFRESGIECDDYDPIFFDDRALLERRYDFIASTEVFEHLPDPASVLTQLVSMLRPDGWLGVMTKRVTTEDAFARWHYTRDPTHVVFFSDATFTWIGERYGLSVQLVCSDVVLLQRVQPARHDSR